MPSEKIKNLLTEEQKASLAPHVHAFRHGNPQKRLEIVRDLAKGFHPATALPAVHAQYRQVSLVVKEKFWLVLTRELGRENMDVQPWQEAREAQTVSSPRL